MSDIGIRELKTHASEIVRRVSEDGQGYIVTRHGRPRAVIVPVEDVPAGPYYQSGFSSWDELGEQIGQAWKSTQTSSEILSDIRRSGPGSPVCPYAWTPAPSDPGSSRPFACPVGV
jgi:prevent-host-death family protein